MATKKFQHVCTWAVTMGAVGGATAVLKRIWDDGFIGYKVKDILTDYAKGFTIAAGMGAIGSSMHKVEGVEKVETGK